MASNVLRLVFFAILCTYSTAEFSNVTELQEIEPSTAVLFPWVAQIIGLVAFLIISRYISLLPFTAVLFIVGILIGIGFEKSKPNLGLMGESVELWTSINSEVLLLVFLPGIIFGDALQIDTHLFHRAFWQIIWLAFPAVLLGTFLTACVGYYVFPFDWGFNLSMTFGAILSATDPVAVLALLQEVGAPPRLSMIIGGESMFNDGSAIVFYSIFSKLALADYGEKGDGFSVGTGFALFFRMSLGGAAIGVAFSIGLTTLLWIFDRKLSKSDVVMQVASTISIAYLTYFTAEVVCKTSGVIATVVCGISTQVFGGGLIHDQNYMEHVWSTIQHLLNTLLFVLAGSIWGSVISNTDTREGHFSDVEWGYLFVLYAFLFVIRTVLLIISYPLLSRIGLRTSAPESVFMCWAGLRGAVGLALAIAIDNEIWKLTEEESARQQSTVVFAMVGGISFLTLVIQGTSSSSMLRALRLTDSSDARLKIIQSIAETIRLYSIDQLLSLTTEQMFEPYNFQLVQMHVSVLQGISKGDILLGARRYFEETAPNQCKELNLTPILQYLPDRRSSDHVNQRPGVQSNSDAPSLGMTGSSPGRDFDASKDDSFRPGISESRSENLTSLLEEGGQCSRLKILPDEVATTRRQRLISRHKLPKQSKGRIERHLQSQRRWKPAHQISRDGVMDEEIEKKVVELREIFLASLMHAFSNVIRIWNLTKVGYIDYALIQALRVCSDQVAKGEPLSDWVEVQLLLKSNFETFLEAIVVDLLEAKWCSSKENVAYRSYRIKAMAALAFVEGHKIAEKGFSLIFIDNDRQIREAERIVLAESRHQVELASATLKAIPSEFVELILSHSMAGMILHRQAEYVETLEENGTLKTMEAQIFLESITKDLSKLEHCGPSLHTQSKDVSHKAFHIFRSDK